MYTIGLGKYMVNGTELVQYHERFYTLIASMWEKYIVCIHFNMDIFIVLMILWMLKVSSVK